MATETQTSIAQISCSYQDCSATSSKQWRDQKAMQEQGALGDQDT